MSTQLTASNKFIKVNDNKIAYRWLGPSFGVPLVLHIHFRGSMDYWDRDFIDPLAAVCPVIIFDNAGVGRSSGVVPETFAGWAENLIGLTKALKIPQIDRLGFSMGGCVAQMAALNAPGLVRRLILAGTAASLHERNVDTDVGVLTRFTEAMEPEAEAAFAESFFTATTNGKAQAHADWERIHERADHSGMMSQETTMSQLAASWTDWQSGSLLNSTPRLHELGMPVLVCNGDNDILVPTYNSFVLKDLIPNAQLQIYPDAGHGFLFQHGALVAANINLFLDLSKEALLKGVHYQ